MSTFEQVIERIDSEISIKKEDKEPYSKDFDLIRNHIMNIMGKKSQVFKQLYNGPSLFGSYLEAIKVDKPDEFDVHFVLKLPNNDKMLVRRDKSRPGFVNLDITHVISNTENSEVRSTLMSLVDEHYFLDRNKLQNWLEGILELALLSANNIRSYDNRFNYTLSYGKCATAHTIKAYSEYRKISIDFVPAFKFTKSEAVVLDRKFPSGIREKLWFAVPKPMMGDSYSRNLTFSVCAPQIEKYLLNNNLNLKRSLRLLKSLRDKMGDKARKFKSYFIKTLYLHENDKRGEGFWKKPVGFILLEMLEVLITCLNEESIAFYWAPNQNLLKSLKPYEIVDMKNMFKEVKSKLQIMSNQHYVDYYSVRGLFDKPSDTVNAENP